MAQKAGEVKEEMKKGLTEATDGMKEKAEVLKAEAADKGAKAMDAAKNL